MLQPPRPTSEATTLTPFIVNGTLLERKGDISMSHIIISIHDV